MSKRDSDEKLEIQLGRQQEAEEAQRAYRASVGPETRLQRPKTKAERLRDQFAPTVGETEALPASDQAAAKAGGSAVVIESERPIARKLRLVAIWAVVAALIAFFFPAFHDAVRRSKPLLHFGDDEKVDVSFYLDVRTKPAGAVVRVNGRERGVTPLLINITCVADDPVTIEVERRGHEPERTITRCAPGKTFSFAPNFP
jgi:hypothetical protein